MAFIYDKDMERVMQMKKREILCELEQAKMRILKELSCCDKTTLTRLREILADYNRIEFQITERYNKIEALTTSFISEKTSELLLIESQLKSLIDSVEGLDSETLSNLTETVAQLRTNVQTNTTAIQGLDTELELLKLTIDELTGVDGETGETLTGLVERITTLETNFNNVTANLGTEFNTVNERITSEVSTLNTRIDDVANTAGNAYTQANLGVTNAETANNNALEAKRMATENKGSLTASDGGVFNFGVVDGQYGYYVAESEGADTFHPFKNGGGLTLLYEGAITLRGNEGSSGSNQLTGTVNVGAGLSNVKASATLTNATIYHTYSANPDMHTDGGSCTYDAETGNVTVKYTTSIDGYYGNGEGTAYLLVVQE